MDVDEEDDFYGDGGEEGGEQVKPEEHSTTENGPDVKPEAIEEDLEEGEEEDDEGSGSDSDIDIITERKDGTKAAPPSTARYNEIRNIPQRTGSSDIAVKPAAVKKEDTPKATSSSDFPGQSTSKIDVNAKPIYEPAGKPITQVNIDEDLPENEKPWRRPGTDISDYFNYGFDEFTWALYAAKQDSLRGEYDQDKIAQNQKKMMEDMNMMMAMGGMPGMPAMGGAAPAMPGMDGGMPPEMQAMMQQMMASGMDPSQMDPTAMMQMMGQAGGQGAGQAQGFGAQQGFGQEGYGGFNQNIGAGRGNFRGRGRGRGHQGW